MVQFCLLDAAFGEPHALLGLLDYLLNDLYASPSWIIEMADKYFDIPKQVSTQTLDVLKPVLIQ